MSAPGGSAGAGDPHRDEVERLWREFATPLRRFFRRRVPGEDDAEELLQETFLRVQSSLADVSSAERYPAWIRRVARNVWLDRLRRRGEGVELDLDRVEAEQEHDLGREVAGWVEDVIAELPPVDRELLRRVELAGEPREVVARDLGLSPSALKSRVTRGREKIRARLLDCCAFEFDRRGGLLDVRRRAGGDCGCADGAAATPPRPGS